MSIHIRPFADVDRDSVIDVILPIQREEFGVPVTLDDQPDLLSIPEFYQQGRGNFWVAELDGHIIGTIALKEFGSNQGAIRKMFVAAPYRGAPHKTGQLLLDRLFKESKERGIQEIFLGTTEHFLAAHRFYERNGFEEIAKENLPEDFPLVAVDTKFYAIALPTRSEADSPAPTS